MRVKAGEAERENWRKKREIKHRGGERVIKRARL